MTEELLKALFAAIVVWGISAAIGLTPWPGMITAFFVSLLLAPSRT